MALSAASWGKIGLSTADNRHPGRGATDRARRCTYVEAVAVIWSGSGCDMTRSIARTRCSTA